MGPYPLRVALSLRIPGWGFHTVQGGIDSENHHFLSPVCCSCRGMEKNDPGMRPYPPREALAPRILGWGLHTVRGGIDPGTDIFVPGLLEL